MKAIQIHSAGGPEVMQYSEVADPIPSHGEVLVRVGASGVNFIDIYVREGLYGNRLPLIPGQEAAGTVISTGNGVSEWQSGDRVAWCSVLGTYAELAICPADRLVRIPEFLTFDQAAAVLLQGMTAHYLAHAAYLIREGDEILIHAGAGGTGLLLTQMAKALGARVLTTVSTEAKGELSRQAGADHVILYSRGDFAAEVRRLTDGRLLTAVYDSVGRTTFEGSLSSLKTRGTLVLFGTASGHVPSFDLERLGSMGSLHVTRPILPHYTRTRSELVERSSAVMDAVAAGRLQLRLEHSYALSEAAQAHRDLDSRATTGKLLLIP